MSKQIVIIGFMGSGKTTVARALAHVLGWPLIDLDELIRENEGSSAREIIERDGEQEFRTVETKILREVLNQNAANVVSLGGGAWTIAENRRLIAAAGAFTVWLDAPFDLCWQRIEQEGKSRPLAASREAAQELYCKRLPIYELAEARITITEHNSAEDVASRIINEVSVDLSPSLWEGE